MKLGQLIDSNQNFFIKNYAENKAGGLVPDIFLFLNMLNMR